MVRGKKTYSGYEIQVHTVLDGGFASPPSIPIMVDKTHSDYNLLETLDEYNEFGIVINGVNLSFMRAS